MAMPIPIIALPLIEQIDQLLPQTQCQRCGFPDCRSYADALSRGESEINRCPPGSEATITALARLLARPVLPLADDLVPMPGRQVVRIDPNHCIGCTKCIRACPVDAIVGASRFQHQVLTDRCTGCELCLPPCPTDCIDIVALAGHWQASDASRGRRHHGQREQRLMAERLRERLPRPTPAEPPAHDPVTDPAIPATPELAPLPGRIQPPALAGTPAGTGLADAVPGAAAADAALSAMAAGAATRVATGPEAGPRPGACPPAAAVTPLAEALASQRDPRLALANPDEKARRLAAIRQKLAASKRPSPSGSQP